MNLNDLNIHRRRKCKQLTFYFIYLIIILCIYFAGSDLYSHNSEKRVLVERVLTRQKNFQDFSLVAPKYKPNRELRKVLSFTYDFWSQSEVLPRAYSIVEHKQLMGLIEIVMKLFKESVVEYMIINESLLGSWRNWDVIPWKKDTVRFF